ncbi:THAP domain-containing protein 2-like [Homarus americanus]|uniref:THAP domain-containing protein 2-like n=1 Tax=Homarus americanus TaxID=6706 RepID=UPI001C477C88|nr:THAP domain-containing protein 2-like [Homarus americanus]
MKEKTFEVIVKGTEDEETTTKRKFPRTFHGFPSNPEKRKQWLVQMHREDWSPTSHSKICSDHFEEENIDRTGQIVRLKANTVPTRFKKFPKHLQKVYFYFMDTKLQVNERTPKKRHHLEVSSSEHQIEEDKDMEAKPAKIQHSKHSYCFVDSPRELKQKLNKSNEKICQLKNLKYSQQKSHRLTRQRRLSRSLGLS